MTADFGTDAFGTYLPYHDYGLSKETPWGIYLFLEPLLTWSDAIADRAGSLGIALSKDDALLLAFFATFRHELFHFHVERFAVRQEVIQRRPIYLPYDQNVFTSTPAGPDWLEECLAQACVLDSQLVAKRTGLKPSQVRTIFRSEFKTFGPGYRDFDCHNHGGPERAHKLFGAQITTANKAPGYSLTEFATPKKGYMESSAVAPAFVVFRPSFVARFQLAMPKAHAWAKFAALNDLVFVGPGPGDHEIWALGKQRFHLNCKRGEIDFASAKAAGKIMNASVREVAEAIRNGRKIKPRAVSEPEFTLI